MRTKLLTGLVTLVAFAAMAVPTLASAEVPADQVPAELKQAIRVHVESQQKPYAGLCRETNAHPGEYCGFVLSLSATTAEVSYGRALSDELTKATFNRVGGAWVAPSAADAPSELKAAIKGYVESTGKSYVGLCNEVEPTIGQYCGFILSRTDIVAQVTFGPYATDDITRAQFRLENGAWRLSGPVSDSPGSGSPVPLPPKTGNTAAGGGSSTLIAVAAVLLVVGAGSVALGRRARSR